jgi:hypothetical protein
MSEVANTVNDNLVLICGESVGGKSASLRNLTNPEGAIYANMESGKKLPFPAKFRQVTITDPLALYNIFDQAEQAPKIHTIIVDSLTYMMDMYYSMHVATATDTQKAWGGYAEFFRKLMQYYVAKSTKNVVFTAHTLVKFNENESVMEKKVPIKGSLQSVGIESYFSVVVAAKKMSLKALEGYENPLLNITPEEELIGMKHVYQTRLTKETVNERIRAHIGMWAVKETYIDNDVQSLMDRLKAYYGN